MAINAMHVAKTGLNAQQVRMQVISNNLANVNTNGFKRDRANFESLLYQIIRSSGAQTSVDTELTSGFSVGTGVNIVNSNKLHSQGSIVSTDNSLEVVNLFKPQNNITIVNIDNYSPGAYTVEVYDIYNCTAQDIIIIDEPDELDVTITTSLWNSYEVKCHGESSGFANIVVLGGTTPYTRNCYDNTGALVATSMNPLITGLSAGVYTFEVIDANGCAYYETITYHEPSPIVHNFIPTHVTCSGWSNGSLIDAISGGVGSASTYIYSWNTGDSTYSLTGIPIGTYTMTQVDI